MNPQESENGTPAAPPRKRGRKLGHVANVRSALAWVWRQVECGQLDLPRAKVLTYIASTLVPTIEKGALEARLGELEKLVATGGRVGSVRPLPRPESGPPAAA